jgi:DNA-binding CsgD family transcriptional regulator
MGARGIAGFSSRKMQMIEWRTKGVKNSAIARRLGLSTRYVSNLMWRIFRKAGVNDVALLTRSAITHGIDEALPLETAETREIVQPKVYKQKIKLGRLRRARIQVMNPT